MPILQHVAHETGCPPVFGARFVDIGSALAERNPEILDGRGDVIGLVNAWRSIMEFQMAARVARSQAVVLLDGGLLPWPSALKSPRHADDYRRAMMSCRLRGRMIAGVVSNPQSRLLARMIHLHESGSAAEAMRRHSGPSDTVLMRRLLQPGQRSALFSHANSQGKVFEEEGVQIWFFFLRINQQEVGRVEIPHWVGSDTHKLATTHATILADSQATGYSYVLSQAHRLVVVPADVAAPLQQTGVARYWSFIGRAPAPGAKRRMKMA